jgi:hypothetical protein
VAEVEAEEKTSVPSLVYDDVDLATRVVPNGVELIRYSVVWLHKTQ